MSIFGTIKDAIFGSSTPAPAPAPAPTPEAAAPPPPPPPAPTTLSEDEIYAVLEKHAQDRGEQLNYKTSIVDLMKAIGQDFEPRRAQATRGRARLHRRHQRFGDDEHLAAPEDDGAADERLTRSRHDCRPVARRAAGRFRLTSRRFIIPLHPRIPDTDHARHPFRPGSRAQPRRRGARSGCLRRRVRRVVRALRLRGHHRPRRPARR